jgi:uncharacterized protein (TIGR02466 family)
MRQPNNRIEYQEGENILDPFPTNIVILYNEETRQLASDWYMKMNTHGMVSNLKDDMIYKSCVEKLNEYANQYSQKLYSITNIIARTVRFNTQTKYTWDTPHLHDCPFTSVFYVNVPDGSGDINFLDYTIGHSLLMNLHEEQRQSRFYKRMTPKAGMFLFFPGYVPHEVEPTFSDTPRVSIVTNYIKGKQ